MKLQLDVIEVIERKRSRLFGHLKRMGSNRIPKIVLEWNSEARRNNETGNNGWIE